MIQMKLAILLNNNFRMEHLHNERNIRGPLRQDKRLDGASGRFCPGCANMSQPQPKRGWMMAEGEGRRKGRGMVVRVINLKTLSPIPLTIIPLTLRVSRKSVD